MTTQPSTPIQHLGAASREQELGAGDDEDNALEFASSAEAEAAENAEERDFDVELPEEVLVATTGQL